MKSTKELWAKHMASLVPPFEEWSEERIRENDDKVRRYNQKTAQLRVKEIEALAYELSERAGVPPIATHAIRAYEELRDLTFRSHITLLHGGRGCGKTSAAGAAIWGWYADLEKWGTGNAGTPVWRGGKVLFVTAKYFFHRGLLEHNEEIDSFRRCKLLVIDDLGLEFEGTTGNTKAVLLADVLKTRRDAFRPTVLTSKDSVHDVERRYGEEVAHLLNGEHCEIRPLKRFQKKTPSNDILL